MANPKFQHHPPFVLPTKVTLKLAELHRLLPIPLWKRSIRLFPPLSNEHITLQRKTQYLQNQHVKMCTRYLHRYLSKIAVSSSAINTKCSSLCVPEWFGYLSLIGLVGWTNCEIQLTRPPFPKQSNSFMVSTLWCQLFSTLLYWGRHTNFKKENIIVDTVSMNICPLCHTYFYINQHTELKWKNMFVGIVTIFKNNSQFPVLWALYFWLTAGTIAPKVPNVPMLFLKI